MRRRLMIAVAAGGVVGVVAGPIPAALVLLLVRHEAPWLLPESFVLPTVVGASALLFASVGGVIGFLTRPRR